MISGDCDNNFVFINALQYTIYGMALYAYYFFLFLGYKPNKKTKNKKPKQPKKQLLILKKKLGFLLPWFK